jgi:uncharacterized protein (DUF433 family)
VLPIATEQIATVPLTSAADNVVRVGDSRVTLDTLIEAFRDGATPEEIVSQYPDLDLADVYAVISYSLRHPAEVEEYIRVRQEFASQVKQETESRLPPDGIRARLLARRAHPHTQG